MVAEGSREQRLSAHGARGDQLQELLRYTENQFQAQELQQALPLADEECVTAWREYADVAAETDLLSCLRERLVQLRFPIAAGKSEDPAYLAATRRGQLSDEVLAEPGVTFSRPDSLELVLHATPAGTVPIIQVGERADFVSLVQALVHRNEPRPIPDAVGAMIIAGYNNWDRVHSLRRSWEAAGPNRAGDELGWSMELGRLKSQRSLYQDTFILLTRGPYSGVKASALGLSTEEWIKLSLVIRREHECTHYFTRRVFGSMANSLHDELLADLMGITAATGRFRADWLCRFLGLEAFPEVRADGRVHQYRGTPPLSDGAFQVLQAIVCAAATNLEQAELVGGDWDVAKQTALLCGLSRLGLDEMAAEDGVERIRQACGAVSG